VVGLAVVEALNLATTTLIVVVLAEEPETHKTVEARQVKLTQALELADKDIVEVTVDITLLVLVAARLL
jgi:hypothetical protein